MTQSSYVPSRHVAGMEIHRGPRWPKISRATAAILTVTAVLISGVLVGRITAPHGHVLAIADQAQPFDHFPS